MLAEEQFKQSLLCCRRKNKKKVLFFLTTPTNGNVNPLVSLIIFRISHDKRSNFDKWNSLMSYSCIYSNVTGNKSKGGDPFHKYNNIKLWRVAVTAYDKHYVQNLISRTVGLSIGAEKSKNCFRFWRVNVFGTAQ